MDPGAVGHGVHVGVDEPVANLCAVGVTFETCAVILLTRGDEILHTAQKNSQRCTKCNDCNDSH